MANGAAKRHFLGWNGPATERVGQWLIESAEPDAYVDLSSTWVLVPTRQSGRRLREAVARLSAQSGRSVLAPAYLTPESMLSRLPAAREVASAEESLLVWLDVLHRIALESFRNLLPGLRDEERSFEWARGFARELMELRALLGENGLDCASACNDPNLSPEAHRWRDLARLEDLYRRSLGESGKADREDVRRALVSAPVPKDLKRVVVAGVPDPMPLSLQVLASWAGKTAVEVLVLAPESMAGEFDEWGRPVEAWAVRELEVADDCLHVAASAREQAAEISDLLGRYRHPAWMTSVAVSGRESGMILAQRLREQDLESYFPEGEGFAQTEWGVFMSCLRELLETGSVRALAEFLRQPLGAIVAGLRGENSIDSLLAQLDAWRMDHLPDNLEDLSLVRQEKLAAALSKVRAFLGELDASHPLEALARILENPARVRIGQLAGDAAGRFRETAKILERRMGELARADVHGLALRPAQWLGILEEFLGRESLHPGRSDQALALQGWLEIAWDGAPHAVIGDFVDGVVPENLRGHLFLPDSVRDALGMRCNRTRHARDAYLLELILHSKRRVDFWIPRTNPAGDPTIASRLLLQVNEQALVGRARRLFAEPAEPRSAPAFRHAWLLHPPSLSLPGHLSVTAFSAYLRCPFRFYLANLGNMRAVDADAMELDAMGFGSLAHAVLERFARDESIRDSRSGDEIAAYFSNVLGQCVGERYGSRLPVSLRMQLESLSRRLERAAHVQAEWRRAGWRVIESELRFSDLGGLQFAGTEIRGRIDRIDHHEERGVYCLIDYKTSDRFTKVEDAHLVKEGAAEKLTMACASASGERFWRDLQLPLYCLAARESGRFAGAVIAAYFSLPKKLGEVGISQWEDIASELESAQRCAEAVVAAINAGAFWPPAEKLDYDDFEPLFFNSVAASVSGPPQPVRVEDPR